MSAPDAASDGGAAALVSVEGGVGVVTMDYPARRNALSLPLRERLHDGLRTLLDDESCRVIVLTGAGGCFSAGGDISSMQGVTPVAGRTRLRRIHRVIRLLMESEKPVVAAVEGWAVGAGVSLAAACDIVVAASDARFACSFGKIGLVPDLGAAYSLVTRMGLGRARYMMMTGATFSADQAERMGLVEVQCEPGRALETARTMAAGMADSAPLSLAMTKTLTARMPDTLDAMLKAEVEAQAVLFATEDFAEGRTAFLEKRKPAFKGR